MKYLLISDLHLGSPLLENYRVLLNLLYSTSYDKIFLIGDIVDSWENNIEDIVEEPIAGSIISAINDVAKTKEVHYIMGNHDPGIAKVAEHFPYVKIVPDHLVLDDTIILHGHQFNKLILKHDFLAKILWPIQWTFERFGWNPRAYFRDLYYSVASKRSQSRYGDLVLDIELAAVEKYKDYKTVIMGHTHFPKIIKDSTTYVNTGDWIHNKSYIEYIDGDYILVINNRRLGCPTFYTDCGLK